jgi:hypothetical protein
MSKIYQEITEDQRAFIAAQHMFFVASAPLSASGHVNLSPKGLDCFRVLGPKRVAYLDLTGSGNETSAHLHENGRITFLFCAFAGPPLILRLYGQGQTVLPGSAAWTELRPFFGEYPGVRQIITAEITRVQTSCGYGIPLYEYAGQRETMTRWAEAKRPDGLAAYRRERNTHSIDGLIAPLGETSQRPNFDS